MFDHPDRGMPRAPGLIARFLADDHERLDDLLQRALDDREVMDDEAYAAFRRGLLKHISMEEKIVLPAAQRANGGEPMPQAPQLRLDHGALAALLVPPPSPSVVAAIRSILEVHNRIEEGPDGVYEACERVLGGQATAVLEALRAAPEVPVNPHSDTPLVRSATRRAVQRAGYRQEAEGLWDGLDG